MHGTDGLNEPLAVAERLGSFSVKELSRALSLPSHRVRHLVDRLEREGLIARVGERRPAGRRGRPEIVYRGFGRADRERSSSHVRLIGAKTINNSLIPLRVALGHAVEDGLIARNPAASAPGARE